MIENIAALLQRYFFKKFHLITSYQQRRIITSLPLSLTAPALTVLIHAEEKVYEKV
jgi:hypothetical protein